MELTNEDVDDILALLDSLPYDELDLRTVRFRLTLRRTPGGWVQSRQVGPEDARQIPINHDLSGFGEAADAADEPGVVAVRAPLPGTFYRAPRPGAAPFVEVGSQVSEDTVVGIVETMKLMNPVHAGTRGQVTEIPARNTELVESGSVLVRVRTDPG